MNIIIMGATSGIGLELAKIYHAHGHNVGIAGRRLDNLKHISSMLNDCPFAQIDITQVHATEQLEQLISTLGGMDLYLHVSGIGQQNRTLKADIELSTVETNAIGFTRMICYAYQYFKQKGRGHIAAISSIAGTKGIGVAPSYSATKRYCNTYLEALTQLINTQGLDINVTDIRPGFVNTDMLSGSYHYPMMMKTSKVAEHIVQGISKKKRIITIDWRYKILVALWRLIPSCLWVKLRIG